MKKRLLGALVIAVVCIPPIIVGGGLLRAFLALIVLTGAYEFCCIREKRLNVVLYITMCAFCLLISIFQTRQVGLILIYVIFLFFLAMLSEEITLTDASSVFMMGVILAFAVNAIWTIYNNYGLLVLVYIVIAAFGCDIGAYFIGRKFGKHKLIERVSPKKTVEGAIGGWVIGCILSLIYIMLVPNSLSLEFKIIASITLPIVSQIGDLSFSLIKRNYGVKDFGSVIPGHGGVLDRMDSLFFCLIFFVSIIQFF